MQSTGSTGAFDPKFCMGRRPVQIHTPVVRVCAACISLCGHSPLSFAPQPLFWAVCIRGSVQWFAVASKGLSGEELIAHNNRVFTELGFKREGLGLNVPCCHPLSTVPDNFLFVGQMVFSVKDQLLTAFHERILNGDNIQEAAQSLNRFVLKGL